MELNGLQVALQNKTLEDEVGTFIQIDSEAGPTRVYRSDGQGVKRRGILLCHAWWGFNDFFVETADRLAAEGFTVVAADLYDGDTVSTVEDAEAYHQTFKWKEAIKKEQAAFDYLLSIPEVDSNKVGAVGYSMGAVYAMWMATLRPQITAVVVFYGGGDMDENYPQETKAAHMGHFAPGDPWESDDAVHALEARMKEAGRDIEFFFYPGTGHWFVESNRPDAYNEEAAKLAWERTIAFLKKQLA